MSDNSTHSPGDDRAAVPNDPRATLPTIRLCGMPLHAITESQCIAHVMDQLAAGKGGWIITPNLDHLRRSRSDAAFRNLFDQADLIVADGMPLIWAARLQGTPLPERVAGSSLVSTVAQSAAAEGRSLFLLGGEPGSAGGAAEHLCNLYNGLEICGQHCPPFGFENDEREMRLLTDALDRANPDIVYVALGSPKQENLIRHLRDQYPGVWWIGVGISLSFLSGQVQRAPRWMQRLGLEWIHRLSQDPARLLKRYVVHGLPFACRLLCSAASARLRGAATS